MTTSKTLYNVDYVAAPWCVNSNGTLYVEAKPDDDDDEKVELRRLGKIEKMNYVKNFKQGNASWEKAMKVTVSNPMDEESQNVDETGQLHYLLLQRLFTDFSLLYSSWLKHEVHL